MRQMWSDRLRCKHNTELDKFLFIYRPDFSPDYSSRFLSSFWVIPRRFFSHSSLRIMLDPHNGESFLRANSTRKKTYISFLFTPVEWAVNTREWTLALPSFMCNPGSLSWLHEERAIWKSSFFSARSYVPWGLLLPLSCQSNPRKWLLFPFFPLFVFYYASFALLQRSSISFFECALRFAGEKAQAIAIKHTRTHARARVSKKIR